MNVLHGIQLNVVILKIPTGNRNHFLAMVIVFTQICFLYRNPQTPINMTAHVFGKRAESAFVATLRISCPVRDFYHICGITNLESFLSGDSTMIAPVQFSIGKIQYISRLGDTVAVFFSMSFSSPVHSFTSCSV